MCKNSELVYLDSSSRHDMIDARPSVTTGSHDWLAGRAGDPDADRCAPVQPTAAFRNTQTSIGTPNEAFTLGLSGGDNWNFLSGPLTGTLIAGHVYSMLHEAEL